MPNSTSTHGPAHGAASFDLVAFARRAALDRGFEVELPAAAAQELKRPAPQPEPGLRDLRNLLWSSIDNRESRDLDQIEVAEALGPGRTKLLVGIADVDVRVERGSALDQHAGHNTCSVYTGVATYPMLPELLSTDRTSLNQDQERVSLVIEFVVEPDGNITGGSVYRALVRNQSRLSYPEVGAWLEGQGPLPEAAARVKGMDQQLRMQDEAAQRLRKLRHQHGALELETIEARPVTKDGKVVDLEVSRKLRSRDLIEDFMVAANGVMARFLESKGRASLRRVVRTPKNWPRIVELAGQLGERLPPEPAPGPLADFLSRRKQADPAHFPDLSLAVVKLLGPGEYVAHKPGGDPIGHFGLAVQDYTHSTAPNRRYADLITQRVVKAALAGERPPYTDSDLEGIATRCTAKEDDASKVERLVRKAAAALLLRDRIGEVFSAIVTGASSKGTFVRITAPAAEGRLMDGERGVQVGDTIRVKLVSTSPEKGFIDFARAQG